MVELFGASGGYQGARTGSELNNFVVNHRDTIGVVNLDEFDRLDREVQEGLFTIFDKGEWVDKKLSSAFQTRTLDCRKIIWILTTNVFDDHIVGLYEDEKALFEKKEWNRLDKKVKRRLKGRAIASRSSHLQKKSALLWLSSRLINGEFHSHNLSQTIMTSQIRFDS